MIEILKYVVCHVSATYLQNIWQYGTTVHATNLKSYQSICKKWNLPIRKKTANDGTKIEVCVTNENEDDKEIWLDKVWLNKGRKIKIHFTQKTYSCT